MKPLIFILLFFYAQSIFAQSVDDYQSHDIIHYTTSNGLVGNDDVLSICEDKNGFIWFGTSLGLSCYNGNSFRSFTYGKGNQHLSHNYAQSVAISNSGNVWIATSDGLNIYDYMSDSIIHINKKNISGTLQSNDITCFSYTHDNKGIWIATYDKGINFYNYEQQKFIPLSLPHEIKTENLLRIFEDSKHCLWIGTLSNGIYCYSLNEKSFKHFQTNRVSDIMEDSNGNIWITAERIWKYTTQSSSLTLIDLNGTDYTRANSICEDLYGHIWIGCGNLLGYLDKKDEQFHEIKRQGDEWGKSWSNIETIFIDKNNNIWIGTNGEGAYMIMGHPRKFTLLQHNKANPYSISSNIINGIARNQKGYIYLATENNGIDILNEHLLRIKSLTQKDGLSGNNIMAVHIDSKENIWVLNSWSGIDILSKNNKIIKHLSTENGLPSNLVQCISEGSDGTMYIGTDMGLCTYKEGIINNKFIENANYNYNIRCLSKQQGDYIWAGTFGDAVLRFNCKTTEITHINHIQDKSLFYVKKININNNYLFTSTRGGGICKYDINNINGIPTLFHEETFFPTFEVDNNNRILAASKYGIYLITNDTSLTFNNKSGIQENEYRASLAFPEKDGSTTYYFSGYEGLNILSSKELTENKTNTPIYFTSLRLNKETIRPGQAVDGHVKYNPLKQNITETTDLVFNHNLSTFTITFSALEFDHQKKRYYSYCLEGSDAQWYDLGSSNEITFRNLEPGTYKLKVKEIDSYKESVLAITVLPPFWRTYFAYIIYGILFIIILYIAWKISTIKMRASHKLKVEKAERQKEEDIYQAKLQFFTNISHELRTPLTLIVSPLESMDRNKYPDIALALNLIERNAKKLHHLINQLLDFRKTEQGKMILRIKYGQLTTYVQNIISSFEGLSDEKKIQVGFSCSPMSIKGWFDPDFIEKILYNLLSNAYKFTENGGAIYICLTQKEIDNRDWVDISVKDTGCGIPKDDLDNIFKRFYQAANNTNEQNQGSGIGLHLVKSLIELHHGYINVSSEPGKGSTFTLTIPIDEHCYSNDEKAGCDQSSAPNPESMEHILSNNKRNITENILVVDDEEDICIYVRDLLSDKYNVFTANNGNDALYILQQEECNIVISDIMMSPVDGIELCNRIKTNIDTSHIPVILLTAKAGIESRIEGLKVGADAYIPKPFHPEHLLVRVEKLINSRNLLKQKFGTEPNLNTIHLENNSLDEKLLKDIIDFINRNLMNSELNGDIIAKEVNISRMTLHRKLKSLVGYSSGEFIRIIRLKEAAYQIENSDKAISAICYEVGFNSPSYFTGCFTKYFNMTPTEYLKEKRTNQ